jgi:hypothetical protein
MRECRLETGGAVLPNLWCPSWPLLGLLDRFYDSCLSSLYAYPLVTRNKPVESAKE